MKVLVLALALVPAACASASSERIPVYGSAAMPAMSAMPAAPYVVPLIVTAAVPPPANDISEADRRAWFDAQQPQEVYRPSDAVLNYEPSCHSHGCGGYFGLPISLGFGWSSGCGGGFGVGVNVLGLGVGIGFGGSCW